MIKALLTKAGFTDIKVNEDGTVDATKDSIRYRRLYILDRRTEYSRDVQSIPVSFTVCDNK